MATNPPIQIGELLDVPAPGSGVKSSWAQEVTNRIFHRFATFAARTAAFPTPSKGTPSYITSGDVNEGPEFFDGTSWRKAWNMPWGLLGSVPKNDTQGGFGSTVTAISGLTLTVAVAPRRLLRVTTVVAINSTATTWCQVHCTDPTGSSVYQTANGFTNGANSNTVTATALVNTGVLSSLTFLARVAFGAGTGSVIGTASAPCLILVEDVGPASGVPS